MTDQPESRQAGNAPDRSDRGRRRSAKLRNAGFAVGIGSAAIVAALLYASKVKKTPRGGV